MSKLSLTARVPRQYDSASIQEIVRQLEHQANQHAEGRIAARHGATTAAPTTGDWVKGDLVDNSSPAVVSSDVADYIVVGWVCTVSGSPGTWKERRVLVEDITATPTLGTEVAATSGTSIDFTSIPSWVKRITIMFVGVSTSGTDALWVQVGDAGDIETTGYSSVCDAAAGAGSSTSAFLVCNVVVAAGALHGKVTISLEDAANFTWVFVGQLINTSASTRFVSAGSKSLSAALDRVRITTVSGTDTFDAGAINILYE